MRTRRRPLPPDAREQLLELDGFAELSARNLIAAIDASQRAPVRARAVRDRASRRSARSPARNLAARFRDIDALLAASAEEIEETPGDRPEDGARRSRAQLADERMRELIDELREARAALRARRARRPAEGPLAGQTLVLTGTLPTSRASRPPSASRPPAGASRARSPRRPTTSSPARARARSSRRPSGSASPVLDEDGLRGAAGGLRTTCAGVRAACCCGRGEAPAARGRGRRGARTFRRARAYGASRERDRHRGPGDGARVGSAIAVVEERERERVAVERTGSSRRGWRRRSGCRSCPGSDRRRRVPRMRW